jgi:hypothetical protein
MGEEASINSILTSAIVGDDWLDSRHGQLTPWGEPRYSLNRRLGGPGAGLDV